MSMVKGVEKLSSLAPTKKAFSLLEEFKTFAFKGNVIDLAVGVIIGAAFGKIIDSLVKHIIMPFIGLIMPGEQGYMGWKWMVNKGRNPLWPLPRRNRQLPDRCTGAVHLHREIYRMDHEVQAGGSRRSRPATTTDQRPGAVDRNPGPSEKKLKRVTPIRLVIQADTDR